MDLTKCAMRCVSCEMFTVVNSEDYEENYSCEQWQFILVLKNWIAELEKQVATLMDINQYKKLIDKTFDDCINNTWLVLDSGKD